MIEEQYSSVQAAMDNILLVDISVSKKSAQKTLPKAVSMEISKRIQNSNQQGELAAATNIVPLFGDAGQNEFRREVQRPLSKFRNDMVYTLPEIAGERAITVADFMNVFPRLEEERDTILSNIEISADMHFDKWVDQGQRSAIRVYGYIFKQVMGKPIDDWLEYPTKAEFIAGNYINIGTPHKMVQNLSGVNLPADMVKRFEDQHASVIQGQLEEAREKVIASVRDHLDTIQAQLDKGERLHESLATNLAQSANTLRSFIEAYDCDLRVLAVVDSIEQLANEHNVEKWKHSPIKREQDRQAAETASKTLAGLEKRQLPSADADMIVGDGLINELI